MLIETVLKNGARALEEVYPEVLRGEIKYNLWPEMAHKGISFVLFFLAKTQRRDGIGPNRNTVDQALRPCFFARDSFFLKQIFTQKKLRLFISFDLRNFSVKSAGRELPTRTIF
jgi:hypothetical protein